MVYRLTCISPVGSDFHSCEDETPEFDFYTDQNSPEAQLPFSEVLPCLDHWCAQMGYEHSEDGSSAVEAPCPRDIVRHDRDGFAPG